MASTSLWCGVKQTLDTRCTVCHGEPQAAGAPMSLTTYAATQANAVSDPTKHVYELMAVRVHDATRPMPPQQKLTSDELSGIDAWIAAGAPAGDDPTCATTAGGTQRCSRSPSSERLAVADELRRDVHDPGARQQRNGAGQSVPQCRAGQELHPNITIPAPWGSEAMQGIAFRPITDNPKVLHHWILYGPKREFLTGWAPGKEDNKNAAAA